MKFDPTHLLTQLDTLDPSVALLVALSGGLDSIVLLHALSALGQAGQLQRPLQALHINHQLSPNADRWQRFCEESCKTLQVPIQCAAARVTLIAGSSPEESARNARYRCFEAALGADQCLLLAHHLGDQMETLMLRLTRGAGPGGLGGIPRQRRLGAGSLLRPLLEVPRQALADYATRNDVPWIEDESNRSTRFDRNFWRQDILPRIRQRFPGFQRSWQTSMTLCREADQLLDELAREDLQLAVTDDARRVTVAPIRSLSEPRQRNLLRFWMLDQGFQPPGWQAMQRLCRETLCSDRFGARLDCESGSVRRYGEQLVLLRNQPLDRSWHCNWDPAQLPTLGLAGNGSLRASAVRHEGQENGRLRLPDTGHPLTVRYLPGGKTVQLEGRPSKTLKKIMQDSSRSPWLRNRQPVLCRGDSIVCVPGIGVAEGCQAAVQEPGLEVDWIEPDLLFQATGNG